MSEDTEAAQEADINLAEGEGGEQGEVIETNGNAQSNAGPTADDINNPMSGYWKGRAKNQGWKESEKIDPTPEKYAKTAREYVTTGDHIDQVHKLKQRQDKMEVDFEANTNAQLSMQKAAHEATLEEATQARDDAIGEADRETASLQQKRIDNANEQLRNIPKPQAKVAPQELTAYEANNPWVNDLHDPTAANFAKANYADKIYGAAIMQGHNAANAVQIMDDMVKQSFPNKNMMRDTAPAPEGGSGKVRGGPRVFAYSDFSNSEQKQIDLSVNSGQFTEKEAVKMMNKFRAEG